jgi:hypothetical protein
MNVNLIINTTMNMIMNMTMNMIMNMTMNMKMDLCRPAYGHGQGHRHKQFNGHFTKTKLRALEQLRFIKKN